MDGTEFDFRSARLVGERLDSVDGCGRAGYDHCFVVGGGDESLAPIRVGDVESLPAVATLRERVSGTAMRVYSSEPGVQLYTGNWVEDSVPPFRQHAALCLEAQRLPDSPNRPEFPSCVLRPGEQLRQLTVHLF